MRTEHDLWSYRSDPAFGLDMSTQRDLVGFEVEALDGGIGKVDEATYDTGASFVVVDTGPWIFGKKVLLPAGVIQRIDLDGQKVFVSRTKDQIKNAPELDEQTNEAYQSTLSGYYGEGGAGWRDSNAP